VDGACLGGGVSFGHKWRNACGVVEALHGHGEETRGAADAAMGVVTRTSHHHQAPRPMAIESTSISAVGLFLPFLLVFGAAIAFGGRQPAQLALSALLIVFPVAILIVRARARRARPAS
jgi:hypothetical protein